MAVRASAGSSALSLQSLVDMRNQLDDLQRQLGTGKKSDTYAGLGLDRGLTVGLRSHLSAICGYQQTITQVGVRLDLMQTALTQFSQHRAAGQEHDLQSQYALNGGNADPGPDQRQKHARLPGRHAQHPGGRPLPVLRPHRRSGRRSRPSITSSTATAPRPASSRSSTNASRPISAPAVSAGWSLARRRATSVSSSTRTRLAVRLQARRRMTTT